MAENFVLLAGIAFVALCGIWCNSSYSSNTYTCIAVAVVCAFLGTYAIVKCSKFIENAGQGRKVLVNRLLAFLGKHTMGVIFFQFLAFRLVNIVVVWQQHMEPVRIMDFPIVFDSASIWKVLYLLAAFLISILMYQPVEKLSLFMKNLIKMKRK